MAKLLEYFSRKDGMHMHESSPYRPFPLYFGEKNDGTGSFAIAEKLESPGVYRYIYIRHSKISCNKCKPGETIKITRYGTTIEGIDPYKVYWVYPVESFTVKEEFLTDYDAMMANYKGFSEKYFTDLNDALAYCEQAFGISEKDFTKRYKTKMPE